MTDKIQYHPSLRHLTNQEFADKFKISRRQASKIRNGRLDHLFKSAWSGSLRDMIERAKSLAPFKWVSERRGW